MPISKEHILLLFAMLAVGIMTVMQCGVLSDDVLYYCIWRPDSKDNFTAIGSFSDIVRSQSVHYDHVNGRVIIHFIAQTFLGIFGKTSFAIINAAVFGIFVWLITKYVRIDKSPIITLTTTLFMVTVMLPSFVDCFVWLLGAINYLWTATAIIAFLLIFERIVKRETRRMDFLLAPLCLPVGWTHEGISLPLATALVLFCLAKRHSLRHTPAWFYVGWFAIGAALCAFAPSTINRVATEQVPFMSALGGKLFSFAYNLTQIHTFWLLLIVCLYTCRKQRNVLQKQLYERGYLYLAILFCMGIVAIGGVTQSRACFGIELFSMLSLLSLISNLHVSDTVIRFIRPTFVVAIILSLCAGLWYGYCNYRDYDFIRTQISEATSPIIKVKPALDRSALARRYIMSPVDFSANTVYTAYDSDEENVRCAAYLCHRPGIFFLPEDIANNIENNPDCYKRYGEAFSGGLMAMQIDDSTMVNGVTFVLGEDNPPLYKRPFMYNGDEYSAPRWVIHNINGRRFLFFDKPIPKIARRIKDIRII